MGLGPLYTLSGTNVLYDGQRELQYQHVEIAVSTSMRRKLRLAGFGWHFWQELKRDGQASVTWNFTRHNAHNDRAWVRFSALAADAAVLLDCDGPQASVAIERINKALNDRRPKWLTKWIASEESGPSKSRRLQKKRDKLRKERERRKAEREVQDRKRQKGFVPAPLSQMRNERLTPQFRKSVFFWREAITETAAIFDVKDNPRKTAREYVAQELWSSLERSGDRFAQFKRSGFCLRFDLVDGRYRGEITPLTVSCTKDNRHPLYRRMRERFKDRLAAIPPPERRTLAAQFNRRFAA